MVRVVEYESSRNKGQRWENVRIGGEGTYCGVVSVEETISCV